MSKSNKKIVKKDEPKRVWPFSQLKSAADNPSINRDTMLLITWALEDIIERLDLIEKKMNGEE